MATDLTGLSVGLLLPSEPPTHSSHALWWKLIAMIEFLNSHPLTFQTRFQSGLRADWFMGCGALLSLGTKTGLGPIRNPVFARRLRHHRLQSLGPSRMYFWDYHRGTHTSVGLVHGIHCTYVYLLTPIHLPSAFPPLLCNRHATSASKRFQVVCQYFTWWSRAWLLASGRVVPQVLAPTGRKREVRTHRGTFAEVQQVWSSIAGCIPIRRATLGH
jgi:hypothetical protein